MNELSNMLVDKFKNINTPTGNIIVTCFGMFCLTTYFVCKDSGINICNKVFIGPSKLI